MSQASALARSVTREFPEDPGTRAARVWAICDLMTSQRWERGKTGKALAAEWSVSLDVMEQLSAEAGRFLKMLGEREAVLDVVRLNAHRWLNESAPDRVASARLLVDTVGGFTSKAELTVHEGASKQDLLKLVLDEIGADPDTREHAIAYLTALRSTAPAQLTEGSE